MIVTYAEANSTNGQTQTHTKVALGRVQTTGELRGWQIATHRSTPIITKVTTEARVTHTSIYGTK